MKQLVVIGAGGHGKVVADTARDTALWDSIVFIDAAYPQIKKCAIWPIVSSDHLDEVFSNSSFIVAIGNNNTRMRILTELKENDRRLVNVVHPKAFVSGLARLGVGVVVFSGSVVNIGTELGDAVIVNTGATVDHDCVLAEGVHIAPGSNVAGDVKIGSCSWLGIGCTIKQQVMIGNNAVVGAGATVVSDVGSDLTVVGTPARELI